MYTVSPNTLHAQIFV